MRPAFSLILCCLLGILLIFGCAAPQQVVRPLPDGPVWPAGGEPVRIRYLGSVSRPEDMGIKQGVLARLWGALTGALSRRVGQPVGVAVDRTGTVYLVDGAFRHVKVYQQQEQEFAILPDDEQLLHTPLKPLVDEDGGRLFIADPGTATVRIIPLSSGHPHGELGKGIFERPVALALHRQRDEVLVLDSRKAAVFRFDRKSLAPKGGFGTRGARDGQFNYPTDLAVTGRGEVVVCDALNFRVQLLDADGRFVRSFGRAGNRPGSFSRPKAVAVDSDDNIYVVDTLFDNVQIFDRLGRLLLAFGDHGAGPGQFWLPSALHIDQQDRIWLADTYNRRLQMFQYVRQKATP